MQVLILAIVLLAEFFSWLCIFKWTLTLIIFAIFFNLVVVALDCGIIYLLFVALVTIKRANERYFESAETKTISINLAMVVLAGVSFFAEEIMGIIFVISYKVTGEPPQGDLYCVAVLF
jgi:hypothetical protein